MQIKSINTEHTKDMNHVAFNLDEDHPDLEVVKRISVGILKFQLKDECLVVIKPKGDFKVLDESTVTAINEAIATAEQSLMEELKSNSRQRVQMFEDLARNTGVVLDSQ